MALQRLNSLYFVIGYLGFLTTWIFDLVILFMHPPRLVSINSVIKRILLATSPHYAFATGMSAVAQTAPTPKGSPPLPPPFGPGGKTMGAFDWDVSGRSLVYMGVQVSPQ